MRMPKRKPGPYKPATPRDIVRFLEALGCEDVDSHFGRVSFRKPGGLGTHTVQTMAQARDIMQ